MSMNNARTNQPAHLADWAFQGAARDLHCANRLEAQQPESAANLRYQAGMLIAAANAAIAVADDRIQIGPTDI